MPKDISVTREEGRRIAEQAIARDAEKEVLLDVENLHVTLFTEDGALPAITDLSFVMRRGETLAVVGESGCGKSMTALSIMGLLPQPPAKITGGQINFDGTDLAKLSRDEMRAYRGSKMGMIFQEPMTSLNPVMTAGKQIREGILVHNPKMDKKEADARALEMIKLVGIPAPEKVFRSYPHELSGGMRQRVMIAIALACQPDLLICDEPTTALDVTIQAQILDLLRRLRDEEGMSVVLISHDLGVVASLCDRVEVMYGGMALESGLVDDVFERPRHPYTSALLGAVPNPNERRTDRLVSIPGTPPSLVNPLDACPFADRCKFAADVCRTMVPEWRNYPSGQIARCAFDADALGLVGVGQGGEPCVCCGGQAGDIKDDERAKEA